MVVLVVVVVVVVVVFLIVPIIPTLWRQIKKKSEKKIVQNCPKSRCNPLKIPTHRGTENVLPPSCHTQSDRGC